MSLIPQITLDRLVEKIQNNEPVPSVEVFLDGEYKGTFIVPSMDGGASIFDEIKTSAEFLGVRGNIVVPLSVIEAVNKVDKYPNLTKAREARMAKREKVKV